MAGEISHAGASRGSLRYSFEWLWQRVRRIHSFGRLVGVSRHITDCRADCDCAPRKPALADLASRAPGIRDLWSSDQSNFRADATDGVRHLRPDVVVANASGHRLGNAEPPASTAQIRLRSRLEINCITMHTAGDLQGSHVVPHRPMLAGRKRVTEYLRRFVEADEIDTLRVIFLDAECRFLSLEILNQVEIDIPKCCAAKILDMAYCANAAGFVLVQGQRAKLVRLTEQERQLVAALTQLGDVVDVHFLDYIIVSKAGSKSISSIFPIDRIRS